MHTKNTAIQAALKFTNSVRETFTIKNIAIKKDKNKCIKLFPSPKILVLARIA
jgi:hypothetical protein